MDVLPLLLPLAVLIGTTGLAIGGRLTQVYCIVAAGLATVVLVTLLVR